MKMSITMLALGLVGGTGVAASPPIIVAARPEAGAIVAKLQGKIPKAQVEKLAASEGFDLVVRDDGWYLIDQDLYGKRKKEALLELWTQISGSKNEAGVFTAQGKARDLVGGAFGYGSLNFENARDATYAVGFGATATLALGQEKYSVVLRPEVDGATTAKLNTNPLVVGTEAQIEQHRKADEKSSPRAPEAEPADWQIKLVMVNRWVVPLDRTRKLQAVSAYLLQQETEWDRKLREAKSGALVALRDSAPGLDAVDALQPGNRIDGLPKWAIDQISQQIGDAMRGGGGDADSHLPVFMSGATVEGSGHLTFLIGCRARADGPSRSLIFFGLR